MTSDDTPTTTSFHPLLVGLASMALVGSFATGCVADASEVDPEGTESENLFVNEDGVWATDNIPVCWMSPAPGDAAERALVRQEVHDTWEAFSPLVFTGWGACKGTPAGTIRISVVDDPSVGVATSGGHMTLNFAFKKNHNYAYRRENCGSSDELRLRCIKGHAGHEFGHAIGFAHEQDRPDHPKNCEPTGGAPAHSFTLGAFDPDSIMNYCNPNTNNDGYLSLGDIAGLRWVYGKWKEMPGLAYDVATGRNGATFVLGRDEVPGGHSVYHWNGSGWAKMPGAGYYIAVEPGGIPWLVNSSHHIYRWDSARQAWDQKPGLANGIAIGGDDSVWILGNTPVPGGFNVYKWNGSGWHAMPGGGTSIAVDHIGVAWLVNSHHQIFRMQMAGWHLMPGAAYRIAASQGGNYIQVTSIVPTAGGFIPFMWNGKDWTPQRGGIVGIAVGADGMPWGVNAAGHIFHGY